MAGVSYPSFCDCWTLQDAGPPVRSVLHMQFQPEPVLQETQCLVPPHTSPCNEDMLGATRLTQPLLRGPSGGIAWTMSDKLATGATLKGKPPMQEQHNLVNDQSLGCLMWALQLGQEHLPHQGDSAEGSWGGRWGFC